MPNNKIVKLAINNDNKEESLADQYLRSTMGRLKDVLIIGHTIDGKFYISSTSVEKKDLLWFIEDFRTRLMAGHYDED